MSASPYDALMQQADHLADIGRNLEAIPLLQQASALDPGSAEPHRRLVWAYLHLEKKLEAYRAVKQAVALEPENPWSHFALAEFHRLNGSHAAALKAATEAVRLAPDDPVVLQIRCLAELSAEVTAQARGTAERVRELAPEWAMAYTLLGCVSSREGNNKEAEAHFHRALELDPNSSRGHHDIGLALRRQGRREEALERLHAAVRLNPQSAVAREDLKREVFNHLMGWKWILAFSAAGVLAYAQDHFYGRWKTGIQAVDWALHWSPLLAAGGVIAVTSWIGWRRSRRLDPQLARIHREETWAYRKELGKRIFRYLILPVMGWICLLLPLRWINQAQSPKWVQILHLVIVLAGLVLLVWYVSKKIGELFEEGPWQNR